MSGLDLTGTVVIRDPRSKEALAGVAAALGGPATRLVVIASDLRDLIPRASQVLAGGNRDLKLVTAEEDGDEPLPALLRAIEAAGRAEVIVLGPGAVAPHEDNAGHVLVLSALGAAAPGIVSSLPGVGLHLDVGLDACDGLLGLLTALGTAPPTHIKSSCFLGLTPSDEALNALLALAAHLPTVVWDAEPARIDAWQSHGIAATTSLSALDHAFTALNSRPGDAPTTIIISTSERLAAMTARCLGLPAEAPFDPSLGAALASELPQHVALTSPLVIPEAPAAPNLPPRHRRQITAAATLIREAGHAVLIAVGDTDPALGPVREDAAAQPSVRCITTRELADFSAGQRLASTAIARIHAKQPEAPQPFEFQPPELERLQTIALAALVMRQPALIGAQALTIAAAMTGLKPTPRITTMSAGHAAAIAAKSTGHVLIGLESSAMGRRQAPQAPPLPRLCTTSAAAEAAFDALIDANSAALAYEARFVATIPTDSTRVVLTVDHQPVASAFSYDDGLVRIAGLLPSAHTTALPAEFQRILARTATLMRDLNVLSSLRLVFASPPLGAPAHLVDAHIRLSNPNLSSVRG